MTPPPAISPVTGRPVPDSYIHSDSFYFRDTSGRTVLLRGVNLSGSSKAPRDQPAHKLEGFWETAEEGRCSWVGRTLDLEDGTADVHLARLRAWGFNCLRYIFTWEAIEHKAPGVYDQEYLDYTIAVLRKCKEYGFKVFMDPHQDIWSRFCGGSGAPIWTLYACGLNPRNITATQAACLQNEYPSVDTADPANFPPMIWSTNYTRLACQVMFTLFFGGRDFAPRCIIDGVNIQDWLQARYLGACEKMVEAVAGAEDLFEECVIGWDSMNEPGEGLIGQDDLSVIPTSQANKNGPNPTAFECMLLGMGKPVTVETFKIGSLGPAKTGMITIDPKGVKVWMDADAESKGSKWGWHRDPRWELGKCIWAMHGVWDIESSSIIDAKYFSRNPTTGKPVEFVQDYWKHHWVAYAQMIRKHHAEAIHFIQPPVFHKPPRLPEELLGKRAALSHHYYDGLTLITKHWNWFNADALGILRGHYRTVVQALRVGEKAIRNSLQTQLAILQSDAEILGDYPTLIGEIGIPYDMDDRKAYGFVDGGRGEGDYSAQQKALDASLNATDGPNALSWTMWVYVADNSHEWGDLWNGEDLSIWSEDDTERAMSMVDYLPNTIPGGMTSNGNDKGMSIPSSGTSLSRRRSPQLVDTPTTTNGAPVTNGSTIISSNQLLSESPHSSSASLSTSASASASASHEFVDKVSPAIIRQGSTIPPKLLLDGARALAAFCRPYPVATVGKPSGIDFDIKSSTFRYSAIVDSDDLIAADVKGVTTEIYVPYVHYGSDESFVIDTPSGKQGGMALDIDVLVSHGDCEIQGQYLYWNYNLSRPSDGKPFSELVTIEIKRRGGPIEMMSKPSIVNRWYTSMLPCAPSCTIM